MKKRKQSKNTIDLSPTPCGYSLFITKKRKSLKDRRTEGQNILLLVETPSRLRRTPSLLKKRESFKTHYLARRSKREEDIATFISQEFLRVAER